MAPAPSTLPSLEADDLDDLVYYSRTGELSEFKTTLTTLSSKHSAPASQILLSAVDSTTPTTSVNLGSTDPSTTESPLKGNTLLHFPAANGFPETLTYLLSTLREYGVSDPNRTPSPVSRLINHTNGAGNTALHWAAMNGQVDCVKILVAGGADPDIKNAAGRDAVAEARECGKDGGVEAAEWLEAQRCGVTGVDEELVEEVVEGKKTGVEEIVVDAAEIEVGNVG